MRALGALGALGTLVVLGLVFAAWWKQDQGVRVLEIQAGPEFWRDNGYIEMIPPLRPPERAENQLRISVWLRLPEHGVLSVIRDSASGLAVLCYPAETEAVRVEVLQPSGASYVSDVRGVRVSSAKAQQLYVLKPRSVGDRRRLRGWSWSRADSVAQARATQLASEFVTQGMSEAQARTAQAQVATELGELTRGTDADGVFQIQSVLDEPAALRAGEPRAQGSCRARRYLYEHLDAEGRAAFIDAFRACRIAN